MLMPKGRWSSGRSGSLELPSNSETSASVVPAPLAMIGAEARGMFFFVIWVREIHQLKHERDQEIKHIHLFFIRLASLPTDRLKASARPGMNRSLAIEDVVFRDAKPFGVKQRSENA
jgi:hypothetical protein